jgi:hypothetical protein
MIEIYENEQHFVSSVNSILECMKNIGHHNYIKLGSPVALLFQFQMEDLQRAAWTLEA